MQSLVRFSLSLDTTGRVARNVIERVGAPILTGGEVPAVSGADFSPIAWYHCNRRERVPAVGFRWCVALGRDVDDWRCGVA